MGSSFQSVHDFAQQFLSEYQDQSLSYLFNNAGIMAIPNYTTTVDGYEQQIGVNHLGHYYLTRLMLPKLTETSRVITVSSVSHKKAPDPIHSAIEQMEAAIADDNAMAIGYEKWRNYGISKAFNILFARELQRRHDFISVSLHPGVIKSGLQLYLSEEAIKNKKFDKDILTGTATQLWTALMPRDSIQRGGYYEDCALHNDRLRNDLQPPDGFFNEGFDADDTLEYKLWTISERLIMKKGFPMS